MKKIVFVFFITCTLLIYAENYNTYNFELMSQYPYGTEHDVFGHNTGYSTDPYGPSAIGVSNDGNYYIFDNWEKKIVVLGFDYKVIDEILLKDFITDGRWLSPLSTNINSHQNGVEIIGSASHQAFRVLDTGIAFFYQDFETYTTYNYLGNVLFFMKNRSLLSIPNPGPDPEVNNRKILNATQARELFNEPEKYGLEGVTLENGKLFVDGELQTRDYETFYRYWENKNNNASLKMGDESFGWDATKYLNQSCVLIGKDSSNNTYWTPGYPVMVFNENGYLIDFFIPEPDRLMQLKKTSYAVHPSGNIYFLGYDSDAVYLYRIQNVWDPQGRADWYALHGETVAADTRIGTLNASRVRFRTAPVLSSETLGFLNEGEKVIVLEQSEEKMVIGEMEDYWYKLRRGDGSEGWAYGWFVDLE